MPTTGDGASPLRDDVGPPADRALSAQLDDIIRRFSGSIRATGARYRLDPSDIGDAEQEVRIRLWRACGDSENISKLSASYLQRVVTTAVLDLLRRRRRTAMHDPVEDLPLPAPGPGPDADVEAASLGIIVRGGVESLGPARRTVVKPHLEGFRRDEIEALLGWSEAKTRNLLYRGLSDLRAYLVARGISWGDEE
jgi:RNA polymerase sigma-70 factor (ECF subfamily)